MTDVVIVEGARTPFGRFCGGLRTVSAIDLAVFAVKGALERAGLPSSEHVDHLVFGNVIQTSPDAAYLSRHVALAAGLPVECSAVTVNRLCGSGLEAILYGARLIQTGEAEIVVAGGSENMSQAPFVVRGARDGLPLGPAVFEDMLWAALTDAPRGPAMADTAENVAERFKITRDAQDEYAVRSHTLAAAARAAGRLAEEIVAVPVKGARGAPQTVADDEHIRPDVTVERLRQLPARFREHGSVTAGNSSGVNDGAAAVVLVRERAAARHGLRPIGRLVASATAGVPPEIMGIGPVPASREALSRAELTLDQMDVIEVNEAFAAQYLAVEQELGLDRRRVNPNGGAIALGHPLGASGARLALTLLYELRRRRERYGLAALCIGGGQGIAAVVESAA